MIIVVGGVCGGGNVKSFKARFILVLPVIECKPSLLLLEFRYLKLNDIFYRYLGDKIFIRPRFILVPRIEEFQFAQMLSGLYHLPN